MAGEARTLYDALATVPEATQSQIRQAYRKQALRWHPDKAHPADKALAEKRFQEIAQAYEVLSNGQQRRIYDLYLRCRSQGFLEVSDPQDPMGPCLEVPFRNWDEFSRLFSSGQLQSGSWPGEDSSRYEDSTADASDSPISVWEWLIAGGVFLGFGCIAVWRHLHHAWLREMPLLIYLDTVEYAVPVSYLMSPLFFGTVPFKQAVDFMSGFLQDIEH
eukprot:TRINITY_DN19646_c0_g1_i1.p1 TRINITY_DN19646_c0_g1~~TRINITY_DN19646_c0_g1_i1.p1  ORF type:complete len:217 (+),score=30.14 TRINITY_DN19646_c0_g1_i1:66-716(+)